MTWRLGRLPIRTRLTLWYTGVLLGILLVISALSYAMIRRSLVQDLDDSLDLVAQVIHDTGYTRAGGSSGSGAERAVREILGPEFYDKFFQVRDPEGGTGSRSPEPRDATLPLSPRAREHAARGARTFETVQLGPRDRVRLLTVPILQDGQLVQLLQVGISFRRTDQTLARYLEALLALIPVGLGLAVLGGAVTARAALAPVGTMSRGARRITAEDLSGRIVTRGTGDELDHLAGTLNAMLDRLEEAFGQMRRFAADAAHELRTPLTVLKGEIEVALRADRSAEAYRRVLGSSLEEVERLIRLAEDLLLLSRMSAGGEAPRGRVELEGLVLDALDAGARLAKGTGVAVRLTSSVPAVVTGEGAALRRVLLNLVENAVKYTPAGGLVELSLDRDDRVARIAVRDTGPGIDTADTERVFRPFVRLDAARTRETGGAGLGLAIARSIVRAHGGTLGLDTARGEGSRFTVCLPLA